MKAYFGEPAESAKVLSGDGWLDTGDLGYQLDGQIVITGRAKDLIIVNGRNVWPQDLEWTAEAETAGLRGGDVAMFSVFEDDGERVVALVQCRVSDEAARAGLRTQVANLLRHSMAWTSRWFSRHPTVFPRPLGENSAGGAKALYQSGAFDSHAVRVIA